MKAGCYAVLCALLASIGLARAETPQNELGAGALFVICSATPSANKLMDATCDAYLEGFVTGMKSAGSACPPPRSYRSVRKVLLGLPKAVIGEQTAAELLAPLILAAYRCGEQKPDKS